jgi:hypothetical protein
VFLGLSEKDTNQRVITNDKVIYQAGTSKSRISLKIQIDAVLYKFRLMTVSTDKVDRKPLRPQN